MKKLSCFLLVSFISFSCAHSKDNKNKFKGYSDLANFVCSVINEKPSFDFSKKFHPVFVKAITYEKLVGIFTEFDQKYGKCTEVEAKTKDGLNGTLKTTHKSGDKLKFSLILKKDNGELKISGFWFSGKEISIKSFSQLKSISEKQEGNFSILFKKLDDEDIFKFRENKRHSLGSVFKLYITAEIIRQVEEKKLSWNQEIAISNKLKSLPSGVMQNLKEGTKAPILEYAKKMISISDNTATDHLLHVVGKENVEEVMSKESLNSFLKDNSPFISTFDMFKTRAYFSAEDVNKYLNSNRESRLKMLDAVPASDHLKLIKKLSSWKTPKFIEEIEWFASPRDICGLYQWMDNKNDKEFRNVIGINTPFVDLKTSKRWSYAGFKGGSEPGVLELSYLLEDKNGERYCFYIGQNNPRKDIDQGKFYGLTEGILNFLDKR